MTQVRIRTEVSLNARAQTVAVNLPVLFAIRDPIPRTPSFTKQLFHCSLVAVIAYLTYLFVTHFVLQSVQVVGVSMSPTLEPAGYYFLNRCVYLVRDPHPNDIVVIRDPSDNRYSVKRVVAGAGDSVYLKSGRVYVNGHELVESYLAPGTPTFPPAKQTDQSVRCGEDQYFLLGDNRQNSMDSRSYGPVPRQNILGVVIR